MKRLPVHILIPITVVLVVILGLAALATAVDESRTFLPVVMQPEPTATPTVTPTATPTATPQPGTMVEMRAIWVSRFDWLGDYTPQKIDEIVGNVADAGFNAIFFQVRGEADAFYESAYEPWSARLTGTLGQNPGWDPLGYLIQQAHARNIQVHAYLNIYAIWVGCNPPPAGTNPPHLYYRIAQEHGTTDGKLNGLQWYSNGNVVCSPSDYQRSSPASVFVDNHLMDVAADLVTHYAIDGIHLDHIRYGGSTTSCDPVSAAAAGVPCFSAPPNGYASYGDWQRTQVNGTVWKFYTQIVPQKEGLWLSAAVWPSYNTGYNNYYQDPKSWLGFYDGVSYIDSVSPMIYPGVYNCPDNSSWTQTVWYNTVAEYQGARNGRYIIPGIGAGYCTFNEIEARINMARSLGTAGHAIFSYSGLKNNQYFDDLRNGPYAETAVVPPINWHP
ncbi:MAG: family 10 glycosylhydrolase [Anaerolinea sp.]|nr:family 10 glycosylhydrolase [Anaerolinea sp.]